MSRNPEVALTLKARDEASRPVARAMQDLERQTQRAEKAVVGLSRESQRMANAREQLGVRSERAIQREIRLTEAAYKRLAGSGTLSAKEQSRAYDAMRDKVAGLRREMAGVSQLQRGMVAGARALTAGIAGAAAGGYVAAQPVKRTMDYDRRLAMMSNTAFSERDLAGRRAGMRDLDEAIKRAVRMGGGSREGAADTLDNLLSSGAMSQKSAINLLPTLQKYSTATGADPSALGDIAIRAMQTFKIKESELPMVLDMAIKAGQEGGFELKDMSNWLPQQMAAAKQSGMSGMAGMAKLLAVNQAAVITAGTKDEAGNNVVNLLAKINSKDTAIDAAKLSATTFQEKKKGEKSLDLTGELAAAREKGVDSLDAFVGIVDKVVAQDKRYQDIQAKLKTAKGDDRKALLESQGDILQGSAIGTLIQDRQALMALVGYMGNREYVKNIEAKLPGAQGTGQANFELIESTASYQTDRAKNEKTFAEQSAFDGLSKTVGDFAGKLADYAQQYPGLSASIVGATTAVSALAAAAGAAAIPMLLMGGGKGGGLPTVAKPVVDIASRAAPAVASTVAGMGVGAVAPLAFAGTMATIASSITDEDRKNATRRQTSSRFGKDLVARNAPSTAAPVPQGDLSQPVNRAASKLDAATAKIQQASSKPLEVQVKGEFRLRASDFVAVVNQSNRDEARRR